MSLYNDNDLSAISSLHEDGGGELEEKGREMKKIRLKMRKKRLKKTQEKEFGRRG